MNRKYTPEQCKECRNFHTKGVKDGKYNRWCCYFSGPAYKKLGQCKLQNGFKPKDSEVKS